MIFVKPGPSAYREHATSPTAWGNSLVRLGVSTVPFAIRFVDDPPDAESIDRVNPEFDR